MGTLTIASFIFKDPELGTFLRRLPCTHPWRFELEFLLSRLPCGHPYKRKLHLCRFELSRLPCGHPYKRKLHLCRFELSWLPCGHPYKRKLNACRLELSKSVTLWAPLQKEASCLQIGTVEVGYPVGTLTKRSFILVDSNCLSRLPCGHPYKRKLHLWRFKLSKSVTLLARL